MRKLIHISIQFFTLLFVWFIMNEGILGINIIIGALSCLIILHITSKLLDFDFIETFQLPLINLLKYIIFMIIQIYISGFKASCAIITGRIDPCLINSKINTQITDPFLRNIIASSITLTPGTITIDNDDENLMILSLHKVTDNSNLPNVAFEPQILEIQHKKNKITKEH